jgi:hypothetical protein
MMITSNRRVGVKSLVQTLARQVLVSCLVSYVRSGTLVNEHDMGNGVTDAEVLVFDLA